MKCTIPEISWHNKEPVLSVDIQQVEHVDSKFYRLASGGSDNHVLIWQLKIKEDGTASIELLSDLTRHQRAVNVVRWSPNGQYLASADDDANIIIWTLKVDNVPSLDGEDDNKESWIVHKVLRGHKEDIYDMCWSPTGAKLLTGSIDNTAIVWDVSKGKNEHIITDHKSFVQGVAWNPTEQPTYMATLSSDRTCRILDTSTPRYQIRYRIARGTLPLPPTHPLNVSVNSGADNTDAIMPGVKLFHDDTFRTYFRRLSFTPDGTLLLVPSGYVDIGDGGKGEDRKVLYGTYIFPTMGSFNSPSAILVSPRQCTIAVRCCPLLFELRSNGPDPYVKLPYRMVFAIATDSDVVLYDTQQTAPFAHLQNIHYTRLTDLTWSPDGRILTAASTDGFCTIVTFEPEELGKVYVKEESETEESALNVSVDLADIPMEIEPEIAVNIPVPVEKELKKKRPSFLDKWTKVSKTTTETDVSITGDSPSVSNQGSSGTMETATVKLKINDESASSKARMALFTTNSDQNEASPSKDDFDCDCEIIDLSSSLSKDGNQEKRRITPILLSSVKKDIFSVADVQGPRRITPTLISSKSITSDTNQNKDGSSKCDNTLTLNKQEQNFNKRNKSDDLINDIKPRLFDTEIIDLASRESSVSIKNKSIKRNIPPSVNIKSKSPPSAKKFKTNTLLNFIQRGPKVTKATVNNQPPSKPNTPSKRVLSKTISKKSVTADHKIPSEKLASILTEDNARDAWKCDQSSSTISEVTEDIPEDFKLQLEDSTYTNINQAKLNTEAEDGVLFINDTATDFSAEKKSEVKPIKAISEEINDEGVLFINETAMVESNDAAIQDRNLIDSVQGNSKEISKDAKGAENKLQQQVEKTNGQEIKGDDKAVKTQEVVPVKRRVPLITLSSPKNKKLPIDSHVL